MSDLGNKEVMAKNITYYMALHGKTRADMSRELNIKYTTLTDWIKGNTYPRIDKIEIMARYFGIEKSDLVEAKDPSHNLDKHIQISANDQELLDKYHALDDSGREMVDMTIEMQYKRVTQDKKGTGQRFA